MSVEGSPIVSTANDSYEIAKSVLRDAIVALNQRGKIPTAAGVNSELRRLTVGGFSLEELGFLTFREFLSDAESAGVVQLTMPAPGSGQDVLVSLPGQEPRAPSVARERTRRLRRDLWRAFMNWDSDKTRALDRETGQVLIYPTDEKPLEPASITQWRLNVTSNPGRFAAVEPISLETQVEWARLFVRDLPDNTPAKSVLQTALQQQLQLAAFTSAVRGFPEAQDTWQQFRLSQVREYVASWGAAHDLVLDLNEPPSSSKAELRSGPGITTSPHVDRRPSVSAGDFHGADEVLRGRVLAMLSRLTLDELLQLPIPARYLLER